MGLAVAIAGLSVAAVGLEIVRPVHQANPGARAALETTISLSAILSAVLFVKAYGHRRRLADLLLLGALVTAALVDFVYRAAPALSGRAGLESGGGAQLACTMIVAVAFAAAAFAPRTTVPGRGREQIMFAVLAGAGVVMLAELAEQITGAHWGASSFREVGIGAAANHPVALAVHVTAAAVLIASAVAFFLRPAGGEVPGLLLAGASFVLGAAQLQYLAMPAVAADWVTPRDGMRLLAYLLLLGAAYMQYAKARRYKLHAAITSERERIARELHDGLGQDLACIAAHAQRLDSELGPEHPLMIATRHALSTSRGTMMDLSASGAPTTEAALRLVADELERRIGGLQVDVRIGADTRAGAIDELEPWQRDHLVRIAREAIANAALHGGAEHVHVVLARSGRDLLLRVSDDGSGIADPPKCGFGLRTMRARAASLGGQLSARPRAGGGTELELLVQ